MTKAVFVEEKCELPKFTKKIFGRNVPSFQEIVRITYKQATMQELSVQTSLSPS